MCYGRNLANRSGNGDSSNRNVANRSVCGELKCSGWCVHAVCTVKWQKTVNSMARNDVEKQIVC
jgi:hypothetical protein